MIQIHTSVKLVMKSYPVRPACHPLNRTSVTRMNSTGQLDWLRKEECDANKHIMSCDLTDDEKDEGRLAVRILLRKEKEHPHNEWLNSAQLLELLVSNLNTIREHHK